MKSFLYSAIFILILLSFNQILYCSAQPNNSSGDRCDNYGICGPFATCDSLNSPICSCLRGFDPVHRQEWNSGNWTNGCVRRVPLAYCEPGNGTTNSSIQDRFYNLDNIKIMGYSNRWPAPASECEGWCLRNCSCLAYVYIIDTGACLFWCRDLIHLHTAPSMNIRLKIRVASSEIPDVADKKKDYKTIITTVVSVVGIAASICGGYLCWKWRIKRRDKRHTARDENHHTLDSIEISLQDASGRFNISDFPLFKKEVLAKATNNFSNENKLGQGGFGPVYKGKLPNGRNIAIKRLSEVSGQGLQEFMNEVELISKVQHRNLVRILGCCVENKEKMLIYEYMSNKSLDIYLFDPSNEMLDWSKRTNIIEGICRGILYLHRDSRLKIIHRDLKPSNILLDHNWNPKISDFGMARICKTNQDHVSTIKVSGTRGYMAPEYAMGGRFSEKSDVFSFGVLLIEIATGLRNSSYICGENSWINLLGHVWRLWNEDKAQTLIDPRISSPSNQGEVLRCIHIGLLCVQELPKDRPSISSVYSVLISETLELAVPKQPASFVRLRGSDTGGSSSKQDQKTSSSSANDVTLTKLDGR